MTVDQGSVSEKGHKEPSVGILAQERIKSIGGVLLTWPEFTLAAAEAVLAHRDPMGPIEVRFARAGHEYKVSSSMKVRTVIGGVNYQSDLSVERDGELDSLFYHCSGFEMNDHSNQYSGEIVLRVNGRPILNDEAYGQDAAHFSEFFPDPGDTTGGLVFEAPQSNGQ